LRLDEPLLVAGEESRRHQDGNQYLDVLFNALSSLKAGPPRWDFAVIKCGRKWPFVGKWWPKEIIRGPKEIFSAQPLAFSILDGRLPYRGVSLPRGTALHMKYHDSESAR
jgi:hypothetical protein